MGLDTVTATSSHELTIPTPCYKKIEEVICPLKVYRGESGCAKMTLADLDSSGFLDFQALGLSVCHFKRFHFLTLAGIADALRNSESGLWLHTKRWACPGRRQENHWRGSRGLLRSWATPVFKTTLRRECSRQEQRAAESLTILNQICKAYLSHCSTRCNVLWMPTTASRIINQVQFSANSRRVWSIILSNLVSLVRIIIKQHIYSRIQ